MWTCAKIINFKNASRGNLPENNLAAQKMHRETRHTRIATYMMLGKFNFNGLRVSSHRFLFTEQALGVRQPRQQLIQGVLELAQG